MPLPGQPPHLESTRRRRGTLANAPGSRPIRRRLVLALAASAAVVALLQGAPTDPRAEAASARQEVPRTFFGIQSWQSMNATDLWRLGRAGAGVVRENLTWARVEPFRGERDWAHYDTLFHDAAQNGIALLPVLGGSPDFASSRQPRPPHSASGRAAFARFAADAVRRYGFFGTFWRDHPEVPFTPPVGWEIWNEPNAAVSGTTASNYRRAALPVARAIRAFDPQETIVLAGLAGKAVAPRYLSQLYRSRSFKRHFDVVSLHPYTADVAGLRTFIGRIRKVMSRAKDATTPIWITELGWATAGRRSFLRVSLARQAQLLRKAFKALIAMRASHRIGMVVWFALRDRPDSPEQTLTGPSPYNHTGLFDLHDRPKPAWREFRRLTQLSARR